MKRKELKAILTDFGTQFVTLTNAIEDRFTELEERDLKSVNDYLDTLTTSNCFFGIWRLRHDFRDATYIAHARNAAKESA